MAVRLKRLELHGFKSFARPTTLLFEADITAVVGPNGAGKSNIVDALRWVLGETTLRLLRARTTEDLIFAGTPARPRAGFARVTAVFENESGWMPVDFAEVELTRKVYRDGRGEYRLNGRRVRLYEVRELLARVGLADGHAVFIGQGMVDAVLALRPEARRVLFEEAAGVGLLRQRREETLRRLEDTRRNLARLEDLLAELRPQRERLARRARRMQEAQALNQRLHERMHQAFTLEWALLHRHLQAAREALEQARAHYLERRRAWVHLQTRLQGLEQDIAQEKQGLEARRRRLQELETRWQEWLRKEMAYQQAWQEKRERLFALEQERSELETRRHGLAARREELAGEEAQLAREMAEAEAHLAQVRKTVQEQEQARKAHRQRLRQLQKEEERLLRRRSALEGRLQALRQRRERNARTLHDLATALRQTEARLREARARREQAETRFQEQARLLRAREQEVHRLDEQLRSEEARYRGWLQQKQEMEAREMRLQARLEALEQSEQQLEGRPRAVRHLAQQARELGVLVGPLVSLVQVDSRAERAVAAVLNLLGDVLVVRDLPAPLRKAASRAPGQVFFLNLSDTSPGALPHSNHPGFLGRLTDFLTADDALQPALEAWLGRVALVRDAAAAQEVLRTSGVAFWLVVTLQGEVFLAPHVRGMGYPGVEKHFRQVQERRDLQQNLQQIRQARTAMETRLQAQEARLRELREQRATIQKQVEEMRARTREAESAWHQARWVVEQAASEYRQLQQRREALEHEDCQVQTEIHRLEQEYRELEARLRDVQQERERLARDFPGAELDELRTRLAYWEQRLHFTRTRRKQAQQRRQQVEADLARVEARWQQVRQHIQRLQEEMHQVQQALEAARTHRTALEERIRMAQAELAPVEEALRRKEAAWRDLRPRVEEARQVLQASEARYQEALRLLQQVQRRRAGLWRRVREAGWYPSRRQGALLSGFRTLPLAGLEEEAALRKELERLQREIQEMQRQLKGLGPIVPELLEEYRQIEERVSFLEGQLTDIRSAEEDLRTLLQTLEGEMQQRFLQTFSRVQKAFQNLFARLFGGGRARLFLTDPDHWERTGVEIEVRLPGKRTRRLALLSGGERSLTAIALIFALLQVAGTPLCVLDEVDAMLDEANVGRFLDVLQDMARQTQFILITHNPYTIQASQILYGITLAEDGTSQVLSLRLEDAPAWLEQHRAQTAWGRQR